MGGPAHVVATIGGRRLDRDRFESLVVHGSLAAGEESMADLAGREGARMEYLPALAPPVRPARDLRALAGLVRTMRRFRPDLIHTHTAKAGFLGRMAARLAPGSPVIVHTFHGHVLEGYFGPRRARLYRRLERAMARRADCLVGVSEATVDELVRLGVGDREQYRVIPVGLDLDPFARIDDAAREAARETLGVAPDELVFIYVGRLVAIKRVAVLLRAFARAGAESARWRLSVVGDGPDRGALEALAGELGIAAKVSFLGYRRDLADLYAASDVAVLSSASEGTPVSLIEAGASGLPVVTTSVGGVGEIVTPESGILVPSGDDVAFGAAMARLAAEPALRRAMGRSGRDRVLDRHSAARLVAATQELYLDLLSRSA